MLGTDSNYRSNEKESVREGGTKGYERTGPNGKKGDERARKKGREGEGRDAIWKVNRTWMANDDYNYDQKEKKIKKERYMS